MKQNDAVFQAICSVLGCDSFDNAVELSKDQRDTVIGLVTEGIISGAVDFSTEAKAKYDTPAKVRSYTVGMVSNHMRKDKRLNGGVKHVIANPGSRAGSGDATLKALKALRTTVTDPEQLAEIDQAIATRTAEISKAKPVVIDLSVLPAEFHHLVK